MDRYEPEGEPVDPGTIDYLTEEDPPEFDRSKVPDGPAGDYFYDGRTGRGLTNEEWDELSRRAEADPDLWEALHGRPFDTKGA